MKSLPLYPIRYWLDNNPGTVLGFKALYDWDAAISEEAAIHAKERAAGDEIGSTMSPLVDCAAFAKWELSDQFEPAGVVFDWAVIRAFSARLASEEVPKDDSAAFDLFVRVINAGVCVSKEVQQEAIVASDPWLEAELSDDDESDESDDESDENDDESDESDDESDENDDDLGDYVVGGEKESKEDYDPSRRVAEMIESITLAFHRFAPDRYFVLGFGPRFDVFLLACDALGITIPESPGKLSYKERALFYGQINQSVQEARARYKLTPEELHETLYGFLPECFPLPEESALPQPENVFLLIGNEDGDRELLTGDDDEWTSYWHGSMGMRAGDLAMMWGRGRNGGTLAFARVVREAYDNPFFSYHTQVGLRSICKTPRLSFKELESLRSWADTSMVRAHLQNCSGKVILRDMYEDLLVALEKKGFDRSVLPKLLERSYPPAREVNNERDVEVHLLEPLFRNIGIRETEWRRQLPLRMGRGDRVYPDYAFDVEGKYGEESASLIVEAKYRISNKVALMEAFRQASSYAKRLDAKGFVLCALEGLWFFERTGGSFDASRSKRFSWEEAAAPEKLAALGALVRSLRSTRK